MLNIMRSRCFSVDQQTKNALWNLAHDDCRDNSLCYPAFLTAQEETHESEIPHAGICGVDSHRLHAAGCRGS